METSHGALPPLCAGSHLPNSALPLVRGLGAGALRTEPEANLSVRFDAQRQLTEIRRADLDLAVDFEVLETGDFD